MWRCINRITMEPFYFALFLMEISCPDTPVRCCSATVVASRGTVFMRRVSVPGDAAPEPGTAAVLALQEQPGHSKRQRRAQQVLLAGIRCCIQDIHPSCPGRAGEESGEEQESRRAGSPAWSCLWKAQAQHRLSQCCCCWAGAGVICVIRLGLLVPSRQEEGLLLQQSGSSVSHEVITRLQQALIDRELIDCCKVTVCSAGLDQSPTSLSHFCL